MYVVAKDDETWSVWSSFKNQGHKLIAHYHLEVDLKDLETPNWEFEKDVLG